MAKDDDLARVLGRSLRRLRTERGLTLEQAAQTARAVGLPWTLGRWADAERGRVAASLPTLLALSAALGVPLAELLVAEEAVAVTPALTLTPEQLTEVLTGGSPPLRHVTQPDLRLALATRRVAERLDVPAEDVVEAAHALWGRSLTEERDARASAPTAQARGIMTRNLVAELVQHMRKGQ